MNIKPRRKCLVKQVVSLICPNCRYVITIPMCQAVNGEIVICPNCGRSFSFDDA